MRITNEPTIPGSPVKFKVIGFPDEDALRASVQRFYALKTDADRNFLVFNAFDEQIFAGETDSSGLIISLEPTHKSGKNFIQQTAKPQSD
jgi:hypothetical protein